MKKLSTFPPVEKARCAVKNGWRKCAVTVLKPWFCLACIAVLALIAGADFMLSQVSRRTIVFYTENKRRPQVEERFVGWKRGREAAVRAYVEEVILGPSLPDTAPLFAGGTQIEDCFIRDGTVTVALSAGAALPPTAQNRADWPVLDNFLSFRDDLKRNFYYVKGVRFFVAGEEVILNDSTGENRPAMGNANSESGV